MRASLKEILQKEKIMIIDGSMSTPLEALGAELNNSLWTASVLRDQPQLVRQVHYDYFKAGADCETACSYQATIPGLMEAGCSEEEAEELIIRSVRLLADFVADAVMAGIGVPVSADEMAAGAEAAPAEEAAPAAPAEEAAAPAEAAAAPAAE